jgi:NADH:ubiquinone oxidoreductase subunit 2 (subunit N)
VSVYYYLGIVRAMYMRPSQVVGTVAVAGGATPRDPGLTLAVLASVVVTVGSFVFVGPLVDLCTDAAQSLPF